MAKITFIRANTFDSEPRLIKIAGAAKELEKSFVLWDREGQNENHSNSVYFRKILRFGDTKGLVLSIIPWTIFCYKSLKKLNPDIVHACDLECAFSGYLYAKLHRKKFVFDLWDATSGKLISENKLISKIANSFDSFFAKRADCFILPDFERVNQIGIKDYPNLMIVPNSMVIPTHSIKNYNFTSKKEIIITYVGVLARKIRGLEFIAQAAAKLPSCRFVIAGYGSDQKYLKELFEKEKNISFLGKLDHQRAMEVNRESDIVISLLDPDYTNYRYATSTKSYEAFALGKPIITTKNTATGKLVEEANWGIAIEFSAEALVKSIKQIMDGSIKFNLDPEKVNQYSWDKVAEKLNDKYNNLIS